MEPIRCRVCDQGVLSTQKVYRLSGPAVTIGYILLIPSLLGILLSVAFLVLSWVGAASVTHELSSYALEELEQSGVPATIQSRLKAGTPATEAEIAALTPEQQNAVRSANSSLAASQAGSGCAAACGTGMAAIGAVTSFVFGLIGWLLIMKKRVLRCNQCGATVAAG